MKEKVTGIARRLINTAMTPEMRAIKAIAQKQNQSEKQYATHIVLDNKKPSNTEGKTGDRKVIQEGSNYYLYIKVTDRWMKVQLQEVN
jgi:hypothetical protein